MVDVSQLNATKNLSVYSTQSRHHQKDTDLYAADSAILNC